MAIDMPALRPTLEARRLCVSVAHRPVIVDVDLCARAGEVTIVLGGPGAGKTTLLHALCGALVPTAGSLTYDGRATALRAAPHRGIIDAAAILADENDLVLIDEPQLAVGARGTERLQTALDEFACAGKIVIVTLRDLHPAAYYASSVALLERGRLVRCGAPCEVLDVEQLHDRFGFPCAFARAM